MNMITERVMIDGVWLVWCGGVVWWDEDIEDVEHG